MEAMNASEPHHVLLVEDDTSLAQMVADYLRPHGFRVSLETRGDRAVERIVAQLPDAVILDVNLPGLDGFSVCRQVRSRYAGPILILTARGGEIDEVVGLEVGADDYLAKPVRPRALLARLRAHLRRHGSDGSEPAGSPMQVGTLKVEPARRRAEMDGQELELTTAEFELLALLVEHAGKVLSRNEIYERIHGIKFDGLDRSIDLRISRLRKKLGDDPSRPERIKSIRGVGYMLPLEP